VEIDTGNKPGVRWNGRNDLRIALRVAGDESPFHIPFLADCQGENFKTVRLSERVLCILIGGREGKEGASAPQYLLALAPVEGHEDLWERIGFSEAEDRVSLFDDAPIWDLKIV
jgi:hypothetical protein